MPELDWKYAGLTLGLFAVELALALFVRDNFFRPFVGDALVVVLIYCFLRIFTADPTARLIWGVCAFAFTVEFIQFFDPIARFGLAGNRFLSIVVGRTFSWLDLLAYLAGSAFNLWLAKREGG